MSEVDITHKSNYDGSLYLYKLLIKHSLVILVELYVMVAISFFFMIHLSFSFFYF